MFRDQRILAVIIAQGVALAVALAVAAPQTAQADRLKELVTVDGFRTNSLVGVGLVVGLSGTGDDARSPVTKRQITMMMKNLGVTIDPSQLKAKNVAAVAVTAELPAFARAGMEIDVLVSSMGDAKSLLGGTLLVTPLKGADLRVYAIAQGPMSLGGFAVEAKSGSTTRKNHATVGRIPGGATVEVNAPGQLSPNQVRLLLRSPDFTTAARIANAIDTTFGTETATVRDPGTVVVKVDKAWRKHLVHFIATLESIEAKPDVPARVVIDERTGTIVVGEHVTLARVAVAHGALTVTIDEKQLPSQPGILAEGGETIVTQESTIGVAEQGGHLTMMRQSASVADVASALNALGVKPRELVAIFQALKAAGALRAEVQVL